MAINYRLVNDIINRKPDYSLGNRIAEGGEIIREGFDRTRELDRRVLQDRLDQEQRVLNDQNRQKMQTFGDFLGQEYKEDPILSRVAGIDPMKALKMIEEKEAAQNNFDLAMLKNKPSLEPSVLNKASQNKFRARQLANIISTSQDPAEVEASKLEYGNLVSDYEQNSKPFILQLKNPGTMINELGILPIEQVLMNRKNRQMTFDKDQADLTEKLRSGAIKDSDYITTAINKYRDNVKTNGFSPEHVSNLKRTLEVARKLAAAGNVAGMHAINIITNKSLDPGSAVLLSEAKAFTPDTLEQFIKKQAGKLVGVDARGFNVETTYKLAAAAIKEREKTSKDIANYNLNFINNELKARGSKRQITLKEIDPTYRPTAAELRKKK